MFVAGLIWFAFSSIAGHGVMTWMEFIDYTRRRDAGCRAVAVLRRGDSWLAREASGSSRIRTLLWPGHSGSGGTLPADVHAPAVARLRTMRDVVGLVIDLARCLLRLLAGVRLLWVVSPTSGLSLHRPGRVVRLAREVTSWTEAT